MTIRDHLRRMKVKAQLWFMSAFVLLAGFVVIYAANNVPAGWFPPWLPARFVGEIGTALVIAAVVTIVYEAQAREEFARATVGDTIEKMMGDIVSPGVWNEMREQLLKKVAVRKHMNVRFSVLRPPQLSNLGTGRCILRVTMDYRLAGLRSEAREVEVNHFADRFMRDEDLGLPEFRRVEIDGRLQSLSKKDEFRGKVKVDGRELPGKRVLLERDEIVYFPGAYNLLMSELTELESLSLHEAPPDVKVVLNYFDNDCFREVELTRDLSVMPNRYFLPGQSVEVRFERRYGE